MTGRHKVLDAVEKIKVELANQKEFFVSQTKLVEAQRIEQRTRFDIEMMLEMASARGSKTIRDISPAGLRASRRPRS